MVVVVALLVLPSVYTWYNVVGFWNPYDNTGNLRVCVVNEDVGGSSDLTGELHVGDMIVEELHENKQLDWVFTDHDTALSERSIGKSYAAFVIPKDFTEHLLSLTTGDFTQPEIQYYVNEKLGPVSPKITDTGATTLDETINSTFVSTVSDVAAEAIDQAVSDARGSIDASRSRAVSEISETAQLVSDARASLGAISAATDEAQNKVGNSRGTLDRARTEIASASSALQNVSNLAGQMQSGLASVSTTAAPAVSQSLLAVSQASSKANGAIGDLTTAAGEAQAGIGSSLSQGQAIVQESKALAAYLRTMADGLPAGDPGKEPLAAMADELDRRAADAQQTLDGLASLNGEAGKLSQSVSQAGDSLNAAVQLAVNDANTYSNGLFGTHDSPWSTRACRR